MPDSMQLLHEKFFFFASSSTSTLLKYGDRNFVIVQLSIELMQCFCYTPRGLKLKLQIIL